MSVSKLVEYEDNGFVAQAICELVRAAVIEPQAAEASLWRVKEDSFRAFQYSEVLNIDVDVTDYVKNNRHVYKFLCDNLENKASEEWDSRPTIKLF